MKNNFHKKDRKAFTIVELVIVIAVIAILAAVLIPTFANIIKKSNLSADKQAVREMNEALAQWEAQNKYAKVADVDAVMQILADAGYNTNNWQCLTQGYEVYWFQNDNRMVLYNASKAAIEYPDEYVGTDVFTKAGNIFVEYNENQNIAQRFDMGLGSSVTKSTNGVKGETSLSSAVSLTAIDSGINSSEATNIAAIESAVSNTAIANALKAAAGVEAGYNVVYYATKEEVSSKTAAAYASMQMAAAGSSENPVVLESEDINTNVYYISINVKEGATTDEIEAAREAAATYVYTVFSQMTTNKIEDNAVIILAPGTVLDCTTTTRTEWQPCKTFSGYFGTTDASNPVIINGAVLSSATGYNETYQFTGSSSKYFLTGFIGAVYGDTTIENITFQNLTFTEPAIDYELSAQDKANGKINSRNTVGIIGGILDGWDGSYYNPGTVTLRNITVESSVSITSRGCVGGLVGYIGSGNTDGDGKASTVTVVIDGCKVHGTVKSTDNQSKSGYKAAGGLVGFLCRSKSFDITIKDCVFDGSVESYGSACPAIGDAQYAKALKFDGTNNFSAATLNVLATDRGTAGVMIGSMSSGTVTVTGTTTGATGLAPWKKGTDPTKHFFNLDGTKYTG